MPVIEINEETLEKAMLFAVNAHKGQKRKGDKRPYITHPFHVMALVFKYKKSINIYMLGSAAVLHDTVEDCPEVDIEMITREFGLHIAALVQELSLDKANYLIMGKAVYQTEQINKMSSYAFLLKLIDIYVNVCDLESLPFDQQISMIEDKEYIILNLNRKITESQRAVITDINYEMNKARQRLAPLV
jgi:(p)ppGpp synthase/HD superfamily hydrolase